MEHPELMAKQAKHGFQHVFFQMQMISFDPNKTSSTPQLVETCQAREGSWPQWQPRRCGAERRSRVAHSGGHVAVGIGFGRLGPTVKMCNAGNWCSKFEWIVIIYVINHPFFLFHFSLLVS